MDTPDRDAESAQISEEMRKLAEENRVLHYMIAALLKTAGGEVKVHKATLAFLDGNPKFSIDQKEEDDFITVKFVPFDETLSEDFDKIIKDKSN